MTDLLPDLTPVDTGTPAILLPYRPAGAVGVCAADSWIGRRIGSRQDLRLDSGEPVSHVIFAHGDGTVSEATRPHCRITKEADWDARLVEWFAPVATFTPEEARIAKAVAYMVQGRIRYDRAGIKNLMFRGHNKRGEGLYCSYYIAELYLTIRNFDFSGHRQPHNCDLRALVDNLHDPRDFYRWKGMHHVR